MNATTAAIDLAKNVFQVALADSNHRVLEQHRLTRTQFERFFDNRTIARVVMEACGSAHHWARVFAARGIEVMLLPAHYVRAYVRRSKTDAADALALLEAARCADIVPALEKAACRAVRERSAAISPGSSQGRASIRSPSAASTASMMRVMIGPSHCCNCSMLGRTSWKTGTPSLLR